MSLTSLSFIGIYFPLMLMVYYNPFFKSNSFRKMFLLCASLGLYTFSEPSYTLLLVCIVLYNYCFVKLSDKTGSMIFRIIAIALDVLILLFFKYISIVLSFSVKDNSINDIVFPIGLSYLIFKAISYVVDSINVKEGNIFDVAIYITNFLTILSGPLSTYKDELPNIREKKNVSTDIVIYKGIERVIIGLGKKVIIADSLGVLVEQCFLSFDLSVLKAWAGAIAYTLQLFFDFSGYMDVTIGVGYLFGFTLPENFNYPYMATSISDFWKRWHISLTKWFTQYIYFPLGGSRVKKTRHILNIFVVWFVSGIWHGFTMTFIIWAMIYFGLQLIEKYTKWLVFLRRNHLGHIYTLLIVVIEWVMFRAPTVSAGVFYIKSMFGLNQNAPVNAGDISSILKYIIPFVLGVTFSTNIGMKIKKITTKEHFANLVYNICLIALFVVCIIITIGKGYSAPLYAGF